MNNWRAAIPNALTLGNLLCGAFVLLILTPFNISTDMFSKVNSMGSKWINFSGYEEHDVWLITFLGLLQPWYFIVGAATFDLLDGWAARRLNVSSALGKQLDSFADLVSFGLASACIATPILFGASIGADANLIVLGYNLLPVLTGIFLFGYVSGVTLRLARYNITPSKIAHFEGLPSPAAGILLVTSAVFADDCISRLHRPDFWLQTVVILTPLLLALAMVSRWPFLSFKGSTKEKLALAAVFAAGALLAWLTEWEPWVVLATLALYAVVSRVLIPPVRRAAQ
jgi:phosphatidylserine synthase